MMAMQKFFYNIKAQLMLLVQFAFLPACAQVGPVHNVPSPEVAGLGMFGTIPVGHYTGIPDISIPLYDIKVGDYVLPLSANYHLASVKPHSQSGSMGLGWNLIAGGYITRTVNCMYDELCGEDNVPHGFYSHSYKMKNISNESFRQMTQDKLRGDDFFELTPDEFSFNFCGYTGNFYYNEDGGWTVASDHDIKVEFNPANGEGFINRSKLEKRFDTSGWSDRKDHNRFFNKFTLVTPDGCRYEFGGINATEYSVPYYARATNPLIPVTWRLSKIITTDKRVIKFNYDTSSIMCDIRYVPQKKTLYNVASEQPSIYQNGLRGFTGFLLFPACLTSIETLNETIRFTYFEQNNYGERFFRDNKALYWKSGRGDGTRGSNYSNSIEDPAGQFLFYMDIGERGTEMETRRAIANRLTKKILHRISIINNYSQNSKSIYFDYFLTGMERMKLSLICMRTGIPKLIPKPWGYDVPNETSVYDMPVYKFKYDLERKLPYRYLLAKTDSWGYYNGSDYEINAIPNISKTPPSFYATKAETLSEITYPTGGRTQFTYELHDYSKKMSSDHNTIIEENGNAGGLRIAEIKNIDENDMLVSSKKYYYREDKKGKSSGISRGDPVHVMDYTYNNVILHLESANGFQMPITNQNTPDVGYSCVIEETLDGSGKSLGYTKYRYSNYDKDMFGIYHKDEKYSYSTANGGDAISPYTSHAYERGKLLSEEVYDSHDNLKQKKTVEYAKTVGNTIKTAYQQEIIINNSPFNLMTGKAGWLAATHTYRYFPVITRDTTYTKSGAYNSYNTYSYNPNKLIDKERFLISGSKERMITYKYASESAEYDWMKQLNILSPVSEKQTVEGNAVTTEKYEYGSTATQIPYIKSKTTSWGDEQTQRTDFKVTAVNAYGKPTVVEKDGKQNLYYWGFKGQKLFFEIENATVEEADTCIGKESEISEYEIRNMYDQPYYGVTYFRNWMKSSIFHFYLYNSDMQLYAVVLPDGTATVCKYDPLGRLYEKYYMDAYKDRKRILNQYEYHYKTKSNDENQ